MRKKGIQEYRKCKKVMKRESKQEKKKGRERFNERQNYIITIEKRKIKRKKKEKKGKKNEMNKPIYRIKILQEILTFAERNLI